MATEGYGTTVDLNSVAVAELLSVSGPSMAGETIDVTHMESTDAFREKIPGLVDAGQIELEVQYTKTQTAAIHALWRTTVPVVVTFPDGSTFTCSGHLTALGTETPLEDKITQTISIDITGKPVFTPGA